MQQVISFLNSWRLNIFMMISNIAILSAYTLIIHHNHFREQSFVIDNLMDLDKISLPFHVVSIFACSNGLNVVLHFRCVSFHLFGSQVL